jgi:hypothetical protein
MPVFAVEGKLGTGKTKFAVWRAQQALREGRRVASNVDLRLDHLVPNLPASYVRIPDKPSAWDLEAIGHGNPESYDEDRNGVLILDELGTWLNSRSFADKGRAAVLDWLIHARKLGWDVYLIVQDVGMIDKQVRESLVEYSCRCMRGDKVKIPVISGVVGLVADLLAIVLPTKWRDRFKLKRWGYLPRMHMVAARLGGSGPNAVVAERWFYRGDDLHRAYDTRQVFTADYPHGPHSIRWQPPPPPASWVERLLARPAKPAPKPKLPHVQALARLPAAEAWNRARQIAANDAHPVHWKAGTRGGPAERGGATAPGGMGAQPPCLDAGDRRAGSEANSRASARTAHSV